ncbi:MAG: DUF4286 family protein [Flavobacteriales bacterium]|jgi:hypothetical protein|nr:DUF4286 family protein [Flavobacteriales bacterium]MBK6893398.1 DUF4286 family protein [Flavobacteriales bacterium]MBK7248876.1 DUF4286 family protein [Flavobacteriales bacterium]MBK7288168.1 DUF4286 family protein [Flavobacteriales bacterium]MBK9058881.1 DUF4286 family protein [Flavobacteriales bacterium]
MIIYNVTVSVDNEVHEMWLAWMRNTHLPEVMATGHFQDARICRVLSEGDSGATYAIQYTCTDMAAYERYREEHAERLKAESEKYYGGKAIAFRTLLEVVHNA